MASMLSEELLLCPICLDVFNLPISTPCGHNFCKECIHRCWESAGRPQCPVCKQKLSRGSEFKVNSLISELALRFKTEETSKPESGPVDEGSSQEALSSGHHHSFKSQLIKSAKKKKASVSKKFFFQKFSDADDAYSCQTPEVLINDLLRCINEIDQTVEISRENAARETQDCLQVFEKLLHTVRKGQADLLEEIDRKHRQVELKARALVVDLEHEIEALVEKRAADLHRCQGLSTPSAQRPRPETAVYVGTMSGALTRVASELEEALRVDVKRLSEAEIQRARQYAADVTLDPDTAHPKLILSEDRKQVHHGDVALSLPDNPERFYPGVSVLGKEGFTSGRFYYEVLVEGKTEWDVGVGLETVTRKGGTMVNPENGYWALGMRGDHSYWALSSTPVSVPLVRNLQRVGIYVDMECGHVSFYNVDAASLIYTFLGCSFSGRLFPYFNPRRNQNGTNSAPLVISPVDV